MVAGRWMRTAGALGVLGVVGCVRPIYEREEYARLPHVNLIVVQHGPALGPMVNELRYLLVTSLAEECTAFAAGPYDPAAPEVSVDVIEQGNTFSVPRVADLPGDPSPGVSPFRGASPGSPFGSNDVMMATPPSATLRIVAAAVHVRHSHELDPALVGHVYGALGNDFASAAKLAESVAALIRKGMANP